MKDKQTKIRLFSLLVLLAIVTTLLAAIITFAGNFQTPNATVTYTQNRVSWDVPVDGAGVADLAIFGEPEPGETYPLLYPGAKNDFVLRLENNVHGSVGYSMYLYTENVSNIPLSFRINESEISSEVDLTLPDLQGKNIVAKFGGTVPRKSPKDIAIHWEWVTDTDQTDTDLGNQAVHQDLIYDLKVLLVIEDNNSYSDGTDNPGSVSVPGMGTSAARVLHRLYVRGYHEGDFRPEGNITRAEVSAIFARILADYNEDKLTDRETDFPDVQDKESWYTAYIARMESTNLVKGYPDGLFRPNGAITRAEFSAVCVRFFEHRAGKIKATSFDYNDLADNHWAKTYIDKASTKGFVRGYPDGSFRPDQDITRAEVVTAVNRILGRSADKAYVDSHLDELVNFWDLTDKNYWAYYEIYEAANTHVKTVDKMQESWQNTK